MTWTTTDHGSWHSATTDTPADMAGGLALPGSWPWHPAGTVLVRADQIANLPVTPPDPPDPPPEE